MTWDQVAALGDIGTDCRFVHKRIRKSTVCMFMRQIDGLVSCQFGKQTSKIIALERES